MGNKGTHTWDGGYRKYQGKGTLWQKRMNKKKKLKSGQPGRGVANLYCNRASSVPKKNFLDTKGGNRLRIFSRKTNAESL